MMKSSAPGKIILFGEHAVVYDKLGIAGALDKRVTVSVKKGKNGLNFIEKSEYPSFKKSRKEIESLLDKFNLLFKEKRFDEIKKMSFEDAICVVIGRIFEKYGYEDLEIELTINESLKNIGQSSSIFSSLALGITKFLGKSLDKKEISEIAYLGDVVAHGGTPSGIDNSVVTYGGYITYRKSEGPKPLNIDFRIPLIIVSSGEPARTNETVPYIRKQREENPDFVDPILERLNEISIAGLNYLKARNLEEIGRLMTNYYEELRKLDISTKSLDQLVKTALKNKALGAKPTGGWGGGSVIVLGRDEKNTKDLIDLFNKNGFDAFNTKLGVEGVKLL